MSDHPRMHDRVAGSRLRIRLSGEPGVLLPDGSIVALERRAAALLALAAIEPGISRMRAATMLWPDSDDPRRNLRQQLLRFRKGFDRDLLVGRDTLLLASAVVHDDEVAGSDDRLLAPFDYADCEPFAAWLARQRAAQRQRRVDAARRRLAEREAAAELDAALDAAQDLLALDDHDESHHRELMRLHYLRADAAAGLAAYRRLAEMLAAEYGALPSAQSETLAAALRAGSSDRAQGDLAATPARQPPARPSLPVTLQRPPLLAGRDGEHSAVRFHWSEGRAVLIEGEAGLGKSRLMAELLAGAAGVVSGAGRPGDAGAPYSTLARLLRPLLDGGIGALTAPTRASLVQFALLPAQASAGAGPGAARHPGALAAAVAELLTQCKVQHLALDDLHFADEATLDLVAGLVAQDETPRRWLLAARPAELPAAAKALRDSLGELQRLGVVVLAALDEAAVAAVVDALAIGGLDGRTLAAPLCRHTGGNPLFVLETIKQGLVDGSLARGELPRPASVGSLIERRLQRLSEPALTLARVAAIAGVDFSIELAEAAIGVRAVQLASAWAELQEAQVLRGEAFAHDLVGDAALRSVPPVVGRRVHAQCAQWLAARGVEPLRLAWHWRLGGRPAEAGQAFAAAARRAERAARLQEEAALYELAAQAFADAGLHEQRFDALVGRVRSLNGAEFDEQAMQECRALASAARTEAQQLRAQSELCGLLTERGEPEAAIETGQAAMTLARRLGDEEWQVRTACHMATALCRQGCADEALALLAPLRRWVDDQPEDELRMLWHGEWGSALGHGGRLGEAVSAFDTALDAARRLGLRDAEARLLLNCSVALRQSGRLDRALALSRQGRALSEADSQVAAGLPINALVQARDEAESGCFSNALPVLEQVLTEFQRRGTAFWIQACRMVLARLWLDLGQFARATPLLRDEPAEMPAWLRADRRLLQLELARALDKPAPAGALDEALALAATDLQRGPALAVRALRALPPETVAARAQELAKPLRARERSGSLLALHVHVARAALATGRAVDAAAAARSALALTSEGHAPDSMYFPELHLVAWQALDRAGAKAEAEAALHAGTEWIRSRALPQVPAPFLDAFLRRNAVNRELLAAARANAGSTR